MVRLQAIVCVLVACGSMTGVSGLATAAEAAEQRIVGNWLTEPKSGIIQISRRADGLYEGRIVGGNQPGRLDAKNPDPALRQQALRGQLIIRDMKYDGDAIWSGGTIYDPDSGKTYRCKMELLANGDLKVRGFVGVALLGKSQVWTRYTGTSMDLAQLKPPSEQTVDFPLRG